MTYQQRGLFFSFLVHAAVVIVFFGLNNSMAHFSKPVLIDFSIQDSSVKGDAKVAPAPKKKKVKTVKTEPPKPRAVVAKKEPAAPRETPPERSTATSETSPESQAPVAAEPVFSAPPEATGETTTGETEIAATEEVDDASHAVGGAGSVEGLKQGYLKEYFSYIRDIVQKKISYPKIARKMGWEGKVLISFTVCRDGYAKDIIIKEGSGFELLDRNAVAAVQIASPFPKPPIEAQLIIPIKYTLN
jgi:protein TonB